MSLALTEKLTEKQTAIINHALAHPNGSIEPLPMTLNAGAKHTLLKSLANKNLIEKNSQGDWQLTQLTYKQLGKNIPSENDTQCKPQKVSDTNSITDKEKEKISSPRKTTKKALLINALSHPNGASMETLCDITSWKNHSVRGVISQLKTAGHPIRSDKREGTRYYFLNENHAQPTTPSE